MSEPFGTLSLDHSSTVDRVAQELRRAVFEGELESGTALREVALASSLGVSRPTVREALTLLVAEGLATREPHRGVSVTSPDPDSVRDVCRARAVLEGAGVRRWAEADEALRDRVRTTLVAYTTAMAEGASYQLLNERHLAFHVSLVGLTGSPRLVHMAEQLVTELKLALAQVDRIRRNAHDQADSHQALLDLLEAGDLPAAAAFLERHLADAEVAIIEALGLEDAPAPEDTRLGD
ncbi:GntR family transcriptional regulator [Nocardioides deserti]|uniref:GntR family transcriptional regulator n=1 Tax=Nocardioides deserti TaxID=1588644 RepID=A0ABR6U751_9ACTN|nr:GntR family transcriptional regulator [Nocardioides deserti]MBC2959681.1 GntR family transcriptional regulator [Nocardioides deserti]GGO74254.1 GntR family transcriptional regulator [Nocardioides deserti]